MTQVPGALSDRIRDAIRAEFTGGRAYVAHYAHEIAAVAVAALDPEPAPEPEPSRCTHGGDCPVHPDVHSLHNFDPTPEEVLGAVLAAVQIRHKFDAEDVREIAARYGITPAR